MLPASLFVIGPTVPRSTLIFWTVGALASVGLATWVALQPGQLLDLWSVREWLHLWRAGGDPYAAFDNLDYPPNALLVLAPLALFGDDVITGCVLVTAVVLAAVATSVLLRWFARDVGVVLSRRMEITLIAMVFADAAMRGTIWRGQTAPIAILFGALALRWCAQHPAAAAVALSLCAYKPHIAVAFGLAILFTTRKDVVLWALLLVAGQVWLFAVSVDRGVIGLLTRYAEILNHWYLGPDSINGLLSVPWVVADLIGPGVATYTSIALAIGSLALLYHRASEAADGLTRAIVVAALLLWALVFLPHQLYHGALAAPAIWLLMWPEANLVSSARLRVGLVSGVVLVSAADVPRAILWMTEGQAALAGIAYRSYYVRPLLLSMLLAILLYRLAFQPTRASY